MKRKISLALIIIMLTNLILSFGVVQSMTATMIATATEIDSNKIKTSTNYGAIDTENLNTLNQGDTFNTLEDISPTTIPRTLKVLAIGNSFSVNAMAYLYGLAADCGATNIVLGNLYIGGCTLSTHWKNASNNLPAYTYYKNTTGSFKMYSDKTILYGLQDEQWDVITMQQASADSADVSTYNSDLTNLVDYVKTNKTNPNAKLAWHATWAWRGDSVADTYVNDQSTMYYSIISAIKNKILTNSSFDFIIPAGTAIQNARSSYVGDNFNADSRHLNSLGCYVASLTWLKAITGWSIDNITYSPSSSVPPSYVAIAKDSVNSAVTNPYKVTASIYSPTPKPNQTITPLPTQTPEPNSDGKIIIPILKDNFEKYNDATDLIQYGWNPGGTGIPTINTTASPLYHSSLFVPEGAYICKTFSPVPVNIAGNNGVSIGKNAKLIVSYDGYFYPLSGSSSASYIRVDDAVTGYASVSAGRRGTSSTAIRYSKSISSTYTGITILNSMPKFTKLKYVIKITDENGEFLSNGTSKVDIYAGDMDTPISSGTDTNMINAYSKTVNEIYIGGSGSVEIDNLDISMVIDSDNISSLTPLPMPTQDPSVDKSALQNKLLESNNLYELSNAHMGIGPGQYLQEVVSALYAAIMEATFIYNCFDSTQYEVNAQIIKLQSSIDQCVHFPTTVPTPTPILTPTPIPTAIPTPILSIIVDNTDSGCTFDSPWTTATTTSGYYGTNYAHDGVYGEDTENRWAKWTPNITLAGKYNIYLRWPAGTNRPTAAPVEIQFNEDKDTTWVNQQQNSNTWVLLGTYDLSAGTNNYVKILATGYGYTMADAAKFECISQNVADKGELLRVLFTATDLYDNFVRDKIGFNEGQYSPIVAGSLNSAIQLGEAMKDNLVVTQEEVDDVVITLNNAISACVLNTPTPLPKDTLLTKINVAQTLYNDIIDKGLIGIDAGQYNPVLVSALSAAIDHARDLLDNNTATDEEISLEATALQNAMDACVPNPIPTQTPTPTPTPTPVPTPTPTPGLSTENILISDSFNSYADITAVQNAGWTTGTAALATNTTVPENSQFLKMVGSSAYKTFTPVPIKSGTAYSNPGKNARIVLEYDAYTSGGNSVNAYYRLDQGTTTQAFSIGKRSNRAKYEWTNSTDSSLSKALVSDNITRFMKFKAEIRITDSNGNYLSNGPSVSVWCNDQLYLAGIAPVSSSCTYVDRFYFTGGTSVTNELDNLSVRLITDETTPTQYTVSTTVDAGGSGTGTIAIPSGTSSLVNSGDGKSVYITPTTGQYIEYVKVNGIDVNLSNLLYNSYSKLYICTIPNINQNTTVNARFSATAPTPTPTIEPTPTSVPIDKTLLVEKIGVAQTKYNEANANVGTLLGQYNPILVSALNTAIEHAKRVRDNENATQEEVNAEVIALQAAMTPVVTNTPSPTPTPTIEPTPVPPTEAPTASPTPTVVPDYITSNDAYVVVDQVNKKIKYNHSRKNNTNYYLINVMKTKLVAASGYTFDIYQSDETTLATGTNMEPMYKVVVSNNGTKVATYTLVATMLYGDIDGSGTITGTDLLKLKQYLVSNSKYPFAKPYGIKAADVNKANGVNGSDLLLLKRYIINNSKYLITGATEFIYDPTLEPYFFAV